MYEARRQRSFWARIKLSVEIYYLLWGLTGLGYCPHLSVANCARYILVKEQRYKNCPPHGEQSTTALRHQCKDIFRSSSPLSPYYNMEDGVCQEIFIKNLKIFPELVRGFEPRTCSLRVSCSTSWATPAFGNALKIEYWRFEILDWKSNASYN